MIITALGFDESAFRASLIIASAFDHEHFECGRPLGAGYGGFFWRAAAAEDPPEVFTASAAGEGIVNGSTEPWVALVTPGYSLVFTGLDGGDHWFVRAAGYPGVCAALAFEKPRTVRVGTPLNRRHAVVVADGALVREAAARLATLALRS
jgi:hypothetical protein